MGESKVHATRPCRFICGNKPWRRSTAKCRCLPPGEARRRNEAKNLNPNRVYQPVGTQTMRTVACGQQTPPASTLRRREARARRERRPCSAHTWVGLNEPCAYADVLYYAFKHARLRGAPDVQAQLARGYRYSLVRGCGNTSNVLLEAPETTYCFRTCASDADVLAALPGACRAVSRYEQRLVQRAVAVWWLGEPTADAALAQIERADAVAVPLDPSAQCRIATNSA